MTAMATRVLIVEDDPDIAELVARYLDKAGFATERVASGRDALPQEGHTARGSFDLMLLLDYLSVPVRAQRATVVFRSSC
jgi:DNA-binding response OmpR family regulator